MNGVQMTVNCQKSLLVAAPLRHKEAVDDDDGGRR